QPASAYLLTKADGEPWKRSDHHRPFQNVIARLREKVQAEARKRGESAADAKKAAAAFDDVTIYAFRHTSIVRQLLAGVPIRVVAVNHDTSVQMIEKNYSDFIADHSDALSRKALLDLSAPHTGDNVVTLQKAVAQ